MRWSATFIPTLRESPADAVARSHKLMIRAGMVRKAGSGAYTYLPLGARALNKVVALVREEMDRAGAVEVLMPALWPVDLLRESGRLQVFGEDLVTFTDRHGRPHVLAPTHEEVATALVRDEVHSYRRLPLTLYQIQTKFRDEVRPRFGILRTREFLMKDAYSFSLDEAGLEECHEAMLRAYGRILTRCGLDYVVVEAESGAMGGSSSREFIVPCSLGAARYVQCGACGHAANVECAELPPPEQASPPEDGPELRRVATPGRTTIDAVSEFLGRLPAQMIKTLLYLADGEPVAALVRGDHDVNEDKLRRVLGTESLALADRATIERVTGAPVGFAGPVGLEDVPLLVDRWVATVRDGVTGANEADAHLTGVLPGRDFPLEQTADIRF
ncbi:MAG: proline--tRNA ligase, partial [Candidatus Brocadiaceae bacterium]